MMPTMLDLRGLPDPLLQYRWTLIIPNIPGGGDSRRVQWQCQSAEIPGLTTEEVLVTSHGIDMRFSGREQFGGTFPASFYETRDLVIYRTLRNWIDFQRNVISGTGSFKEDYATTAQLFLLDDQNKEIAHVDFIGFHPGEIGTAQLDNQSQSPVVFNATFRYDYSVLI